MGGESTEEHRASLEIRNKLGLHLRAARMLVDTAERFDVEVTVAKDGQVVSGKSIMGVMMLAAEEGSTILVRAEGPDEREAIQALRDLVDGKFGGEP
jgi:phosphocarrier protein HPr